MLNCSKRIWPELILDAVSGDDSFCFALAKKYKAAEIIGIELDHDLANKSREISAKSSCRNSIIKQGDIASSDLGGPFDLIICVDVLEHIPDDMTALRNLYFALQKGGTLLLHVPQKHQLNRSVFGANISKERQVDHVRDEYTEKEITDKLIAQVFIIKNKKYTFGFWGCMARGLLDKIECMRVFRTVFKILSLPFILLIARADTLSANLNRHQGFLFEVGRLK